MLPYSAHAALVLFMALSAFVLSILIVFSCPFVVGIWFVRSQSEDHYIAMGVFGTCNETGCSRFGAGYQVSSIVNRAITGPMVMWTIVASLSFIGLLLSVPPLLRGGGLFVESTATRPIHRAIMGLIVAIGFTAWIITVVGWSVVVRTLDLEGESARLGPAVWMGLACVISASIALLLGAPNTGSSHALPPILSAVDSRGPERAGISRPQGEGYWHYKHTTRYVEE